METSHDLGETINTALVQASNLPGFFNSTSCTTSTILTDCLSKLLRAGEPRGVVQAITFQAYTPRVHPWPALFLSQNKQFQLRHLNLSKNKVQENKGASQKTDSISLLLATRARSVKPEDTCVQLTLKWCLLVNIPRWTLHCYLCINPWHSQWRAKLHFF